MVICGMRPEAWAHDLGPQARLETCLVTCRWETWCIVCSLSCYYAEVEEGTLISPLGKCLSYYRVMTPS